MNLKNRLLAALVVLTISSCTNVINPEIAGIYGNIANCCKQQYTGFKRSCNVCHDAPVRFFEDSGDDTGSVKAIEEAAARGVDAFEQKNDKTYPKIKSMTVIMTILATLIVILSACVFIMGRSLIYGRNLFESLKLSRKELEGRYQTLQTEYEISEASRRGIEEDRKILLEAVFNNGNNCSVQEFSSPVDESAFLSKIKNYLEKNLDNAELSMDDIASSLNMSKTQMYRKIRAVSEMTPNELLQAMRLSKADELLKSSDLTIAEVAYAVGFSSPSYFTRCYKEKYGAPPKEKR